MNMLTETQLDVFRELVNIGVGRAAKALNQMLQCRIHLQVPDMRFLTADQLKQEIHFGEEHLSIVRLRFSGPFSGSTSLVFPPESASNLVQLLLDEVDDEAELDSIRAGTLMEVGNIVINGVMGSISNVLNQHLSYLIPVYAEDSIEVLVDADNTDTNEAILYAQAAFTIKEALIQGSIILLFEIGSLDILRAAIDQLVADT